MIDYATVSVYQDADLLPGCLEAIQNNLPNCHIQVIDGRYETFRPDNPANSTDNTEAIADEYGATYDAAGPFEREVNKHRYRVQRLPADATALFIDADERLTDVNPKELEPGVAYSPRIFNALVYSDSGTRIVYWPRVFSPGDVIEVARWDKYLFDVPHERTDAVTITHRHDLRDKSYRKAKYERFDREERQGRYEDAFQQYLDDEWEVDIEDCPECGRDTFAWSPPTNEADGFSRVGVCLNGDGCCRVVDDVETGEYRYLPDDMDAGFKDDPARLRLELLDAGCEFVQMAAPRLPQTGLNLASLRPSIERWVRDEYDCTA